MKLFKNLTFVLRCVFQHAYHKYLARDACDVLSGYLNYDLIRRALCFAVGRVYISGVLDT